MIDVSLENDMSSTNSKIKNEEIYMIPLSEIKDLSGSPFKVTNNAKMQKLSISIKNHGVLNPAIVRINANGYEMVAGQRRKIASELANKSSMPCIVRNLTDDEATIIMLDTNLEQREELLPSEKAYAYKLKLEVMNRQGQRSDLIPVESTSVEIQQKSTKRETSRQELANQTGEKEDDIRQYVRLTQLIPEILEMVDESKIALRPASEISFLTENEQKLLLETIECEDRTPSVAQAIKMKEYSKKGELNEDSILSILCEEKANQKELIKLPRERLNKFFAKGTSPKQIENTIIKALEMLQLKQRKRNNIMR